MKSLIPRAHTSLSKGSIPPWVKPCSFLPEPLFKKPSQIDFQYLLIDRQRHWIEQSVYCHYAFKILSQTGVNSITPIKVNFDPSYQYVTFHMIRVFRNGIWSDRLDSSRHNLIQREGELEQNIYNGELCVVYFLNDIRAGDVLEFSYSIIGHNPLSSTHYTDFLYFQYHPIIEKISHRFLSDPNHVFQIKLFNIKIAHNIYDLSSTLREWTYEIFETSSLIYEEETPAWHIPHAHVQLSQYRSWDEVSQKLIPYFALPADLIENLHPEMTELLEKWREVSEDKTELALVALRFVQDEVRYFGFEDGMGSFKPYDPRIVFERRFGDCKDKTNLLCAFLKLLGINSTPVLVHSNEGKRIPELLPTPSAFDHVILRIEINKKSYWVDPTFRNQGGSLENNTFPNYHWGLVLSNDSKELMPLPEPVTEQPIEIESFWTWTTNDLIEIKSTRKFYGCKADIMRNYIEGKGFNDYSEEVFKTIKILYGETVQITPLLLNDNRRENIIYFNEFYKISAHEKSLQNTLNYFSITLKDYMDKGIQSDRNFPYALVFPLFVKEHSHIHISCSTLNINLEDYDFKNEDFRFIRRMIKNKQTIDIYYELEHIRDHISVQTIKEYCNFLKKIDLETYLTFSFPSKGDSPKKKTSFFWIIIFVFSFLKIVGYLLNTHMNK